MSEYVTMRYGGVGPGVASKPPGRLRALILRLEIAVLRIALRRLEKWL